MDEEHERLKERARASRARALESRERVLRMVEESRAERAARDPLEEDPFERWEKLRRQSEPEPKPKPEKPQPKSATTMDETASAAWNAWAIALVRAQIEQHEKVMVDATAEFVAEFTANKLKGLEAEVASLRADLTIMRSVAAGGVVDLPAWRRSDVA
jgi:hypothetical protein